MKRKAYEKQLRKLQVELRYLQEWTRQKKLRVIILFEGRDAAGKGGTIKAITEKVSPRMSPMDTESYRRWYDYSRARDMMLKATHSKHAPWTIIPSDDKRRARLNCIAHILTTIPYEKVSRDKVRLSKRSEKDRYDDQASLRGMNFVGERY